LENINVDICERSFGGEQAALISKDLTTASDIWDNLAKAEASRNVILRSNMAAACGAP
jgi:hypothetical protein